MIFFSLNNSRTVCKNIVQLWRKLTQLLYRRKLNIRKREQYGSLNLNYKNILVYISKMLTNLLLSFVSFQLITSVKMLNEHLLISCARID